jgi:hypothetical protein
MTRKVNPDLKGAVLLIMHENLAAIREICTRAMTLVTKPPSKINPKRLENHKRNKERFN